MTYAELEKAYIALTHDVQRQARQIVGMCANGRTDAAGSAAVALSDIAADARNQYQMQQEQAGSYDLKALHVEASVPSNSETGWERED